MIETLLKLLSWDLPAPTILKEDDGDICLDWHDAGIEMSVSINSQGGVAWASLTEHGYDLERLETILVDLR